MKFTWSATDDGLIIGIPDENLRLVDLLQSDPEAELRLNKNKMFWDGYKWVVLGQKRRNASYKLVLYEGTDEVEAVKALKG